MPIHNEREQFEFDYRRATRGKSIDIQTDPTFFGYQIGRRALLKSIPLDSFEAAVIALRDRVDDFEDEHNRFARMCPRSKVTIAQSAEQLTKMKKELAVMEQLLTDVCAAQERKRG